MGGREYGNVVVKADKDGQFIRLKDVAVIRDGSRLPDGAATLDGMPAAVLVVSLTPGAHPEEVQAAVRVKLAQLRGKLGDDVRTEVALAAPSDGSLAGQADAAGYVLLKAYPPSPAEQCPAC